VINSVGNIRMGLIQLVCWTLIIVQLSLGSNLVFLLDDIKILKIIFCKHLAFTFSLNSCSCDKMHTIEPIFIYLYLYFACLTLAFWLYLCRCSSVMDALAKADRSASDCLYWPTAVWPPVTYKASSRLWYDVGQLPDVVGVFGVKRSSL